MRNMPEKFLSADRSTNGNRRHADAEQTGNTDPHAYGHADGKFQQLCIHRFKNPMRVLSLLLRDKRFVAFQLHHSKKSFFQTERVQPLRRQLDARTEF